MPSQLSDRRIELKHSAHFLRPGFPKLASGRIQAHGSKPSGPTTCPPAQRCSSFQTCKSLGPCIGCVDAEPPAAICRYPVVPQRKGLWTIRGFGNLQWRRVENRRAVVELEIEAIKVMLRAGASAPTARTAPGNPAGRRRKTAAEKHAHSKRMKEIWAKRRAQKAAKEKK